MYNAIVKGTSGLDYLITTKIYLIYKSKIIMRFICLLFVLSSTTLMAQSQDEIAIYQSLFGMEKRALVEEFMRPNLTNEAAFWPVYEEYEMKRKEIGRDRIELLQQYADSYDAMDEKTMNSMIKESMSLTDRREKIIRSYFKKIEKAVGPVTAGQFYQLETFLHAAVQAEIFGNIPVIDNIMP